MTKKDNTLSELQVLEGIYEHLSTIEELSSQISSLSSRISRVEERLREPMEITNPMLKVHGRGECSRNDSIYGALVYSLPGTTVVMAANAIYMYFVGCFKNFEKTKPMPISRASSCAR